MMNKAQADVAYGFTSIRRSDSGLLRILADEQHPRPVLDLAAASATSIRERQGMAYYVFSSLDANVIPGPLTIRAGVSPANVERAMASIDDELSRLAADGPTDCRNG